MNAGRTSVEKLLAGLPVAIWSPGKPLPHIYRGNPSEMVAQMAGEIGSSVTSNQAIDLMLDSLAKNGRLRLHITGDPPDHIRAGIFIHSLVQHGVFRRMEIV